MSVCVSLALSFSLHPCLSTGSSSTTWLHPAAVNNPQNLTRHDSTHSAVKKLTNWSWRLKGYSLGVSQRVPKVEAHERCVLVQCTIHKNLHTSRMNSNRSLVSTGWPWRPEVIFERSDCPSPAGVSGKRKHWTHSCFQQQAAVWLSSLCPNNPN